MGTGTEKRELWEFFVTETGTGKISESCNYREDWDWDDLYEFCGEYNSVFNLHFGFVCVSLAQWLARWTGDPNVAASVPTRVTYISPVEKICNWQASV